MTNNRNFFLNYTATTEIYTLSLHDALPISALALSACGGSGGDPAADPAAIVPPGSAVYIEANLKRSEEHTSELQSRQYLVCRLLLEKNKNRKSLPFLPITCVLTAKLLRSII